MRVESFSVKNYRVFRELSINMSLMGAVIGANGTGKSTLVDAFRFLKDALCQDVDKAILQRGGFGNLISREQRPPIRFAVRFRTPDAQALTYVLSVGVEKAPLVEEEMLLLHRGQGDRADVVVSFSRGKGIAIDARGKAMRHQLDNPSSLAIKGLGQFKEFSYAFALHNAIQNWHILDLSANAPRLTSDPTRAERLSTKGENLPQVIYFLQEHEPAILEKIVATTRRWVPDLEGVRAIHTIDGRLTLQFLSGSHRTWSQIASDGTIRLLAYMTQVHAPNPPSLLVIENPELYLYPQVLKELAQEFKRFSDNAQVLITTDSADLLESFEPSQVHYLIKKDGFSGAVCLADNGLLNALWLEGETTGALWRQRLFDKMACQLNQLGRSI